ncbi:unnamed protein product [Hymenolepis diminuta]|uniref:Uncharacterized protein n=1 Tax=Hymenolepis diminuta TaxID=6216 RepID=A0A564Y740_HYMDI|nr:unnamed protein product [Hymenolepis diminuta]
MSKHAHLLPLFSITVSLHMKSTSVLMLSCGLIQVTHIKLSLFSTQKQRTLAKYLLLCYLFSSSLP